MSAKTHNDSSNTGVETGSQSRSDHGNPLIGVQNLPRDLAAYLREELPDTTEIADVRDFGEDENPKALFRFIDDLNAKPIGKNSILPCYLIFPSSNPPHLTKWIEWGATGCYDLESYTSRSLARLLSAHAKSALLIFADPNSQRLTATIEWNTSLKITRWPASAENLFGFRKSETLGKPISDWLFPAEDIRSILTTAATTGEPSLGHLKFSCRTRSFDGSLLRSHWKVTPTTESVNGSPRFRGICQVPALAGEFLPKTGFGAIQNDSEIIEDNDHGLWDHQLSSNKLFWSPSIFKRLGYLYREINPNPGSFLNRVHRDDRARLKRAYIDCARGRSEKFSAIYRIRDDNGLWRFYQANAHTISDASTPNRRRIVCSDFDITRYVDTAEELKFAKLTIDNSNCGVLWINQAGRIIYSNKAAESLLQYSSSELFALDYKDIDPDLVPPSEKFIKGIKRKLGPRESTYRRKSGELLDVEVDTRYIDNSGETILALYLRDISRRKSTEREIATLNKDLEKRVRNRTRELGLTNEKLVQEMKERISAEEQISQQRAFLAYILERLPVGIYVKEGERDFNLSIWNAEMERLFQTKKSQILGKNIQDVFDDPILVSLLGDMRKQDIHSRAIMPRLKGVSGEAIPFVADITRTPIYDRKGKLIALVGIVQDVTDRINSENRLISAFNELEISKAKLEQSNKEIRKGIEKAKDLAMAAQESNQAKSYFMSNISHELRTPLNSIVGMTHILLEQVYGDLNDKQVDYLSLIEENSKHLQNLITDILDLSKIELGKLNLRFDTTSLKQIAEASLKIVSQQATANEIHCQLEAKSEVEIEADPRRLRQVIINLLGNAVKFSSNRSEVNLRIQQLNSDCATIVIEDQGIGIDPADLDTIFLPFSQIDNRLSREFEGTGLGLAIVNKFVELHGGSVGVKSKIGQGSTFTIRLPARHPTREQSESACESIADIQHDDTSLRSAIIVDENETSALHTQQALKEYGYEQVIIAYPKEVAAYNHHVSPEVTLVDVTTLKNHGSEWINQARSNRKWNTTQWFAISSLDMPQERDFAKRSEFVGFLPKPITKHEIHF